MTSDYVLSHYDAMALWDAILDTEEIVPMGNICRYCRRPASLHCPDCSTCWPDHTCALNCEATEAEIDAVLAAAERYDTQCCPCPKS